MLPQHQQQGMTYPQCAEHSQSHPTQQQPLTETATFTQQQIDLIKSCINKWSAQEQLTSQSIDKIVLQLKKQPSMACRDPREIQIVVEGLLADGGHKIVSQQVQNDIVSQIDAQPLKQEKYVEKQNPSQQITSQEENLFMMRSLFKSFTQQHTDNTPIFAQTQQQQSSSFTFSSTKQETNFPSIRKVNLFTKPSIEVPKPSNGNGNGFMAVKDNRVSMDIQNNNDSMELISFSKKATNQFRETPQPTPYKSKRKIKPTPPLLIDPLYTPQQKIEWVQNNTHDCHSILERKLAKKSSTTLKEPFYVNDRLSGIYHQHFYGNYDRVYFSQQNQVAKLIGLLGYDAKKLTFKDFKMIKSALPKPRLFNIDFIFTQQQKLNEFRNQLRQLPKDRPRAQDIELTVGRQATALHPICGHLHSGSILAIYKQNQYMIKFTRPQLGTQKVLDINISTRSQQSTKPILQNIDYQSMIIVIKLLQYKRQLVEKFRQYNDLIQRLKLQGKRDLDNSLLQEYGWIGSTINILSMGLRHIMAKFRLRGINMTNQQLVGKNFSSLLINPLNLMSKQLQQSPDQSDIETSNQIRKMAHHRSSSRIEQTLTRLTSKNEYLLSQSDLNPQIKENMKSLVKNFLGMLLQLRYEGRSFDFQNNKFLMGIQDIIDHQHPEEFNQIHANMHNIVNKIIDSE